jgi:tRNA ligase
MEGFIHRFDALKRHAKPDEEFDAVIELDPTADSRQNLETVISQLSSIYPKLFTDMPTSEDMDDAIKFALSEYKPDLRHEVGGRERKNPGPKSQRERQVS